MQNKTLTLAIIIIISPVLFALAYHPDSFSLSWTQGRGGFLFAMAFIVAELIGVKLIVSQKRVLMTIPFAGAVFAYLISLDYGLRDYIQNGAKAYNVNLIHSWTWMWDFIIMGAFVIAAVTILFGRRWIRIAPAG
ncbi:MAG: thaumarchaeosortase, partial [Thaumarchaeota archaeon]|nr:thaumarchaeosortase [Nitrososphaerota archaeon]